MMGGVAGLLRSEQVQEEIKVTEEQKTKLRKFAEEQGAQMRERMGQMFGGRDRENREELSDAERQAQREKMMKEFEERAKKAEESIRGMLEAKQFKRLKQIEMQQQGANALMRPDITQALGLTEEQQAKMKEVFEGIQKQPDLAAISAPRLDDKRAGTDRLTDLCRMLLQNRKLGAGGVVLLELANLIEER